MALLSLLLSPALAALAASAARAAGLDVEELVYGGVRVVVDS